MPFDCRRCVVQALPLGPLQLTLLPWGGRWVYDGLVGSAGAHVSDCNLPRQPARKLPLKSLPSRSATRAAILVQSIARKEELCAKLRARAAALEERGELHQSPPPPTAKQSAAVARRVAASALDPDDEDGEALVRVADAGGVDSEVPPTLQALARSIAGHRVEEPPEDGAHSLSLPKAASP